MSLSTTSSLNKNKISSSSSSCSSFSPSSLHSTFQKQTIKMGHNDNENKTSQNDPEYLISEKINNNSEFYLNQNLEYTIKNIEYNNRAHHQMTTVTYKSKLFIPITFILIVLTNLPIQYHNENFLIQMKKMQDSCAESFGYFNENQTYILDTLFPYGFSNSLSFESLYSELKLIDEIYKKNSLNNFTIKYLSQSECLSKNYTNIINMVTISSSPTGSARQLTTKPNYKKFLIEKKLYYQIPLTNVILVCDDESYKKSLINNIKQGSLAFETQFLNGLTAMDLLDFQTNVIAQWNISCKNLSSSTVTISYAQMTFLSGKIIGAIFFSMLADYIGRKKIYLGTLYASAIVGSLISMVQTYRQFVIIRFPIAALAQGCFIVSYTLLFELILKFKHRNIYCTFLISSQYLFNIMIAFIAKSINDWRYMQLIGSLLASIGIIYPWLIKESFKWLIVKDYFSRAENLCKKIFQETGIIARLVKLKTNDQLNNSEEFESSSGYWPMIIWQPTFRKIISYFVFLWSILSLINFFINEENIKLTTNNINNYASHNLLIFSCNIFLGLVYLKVGKRFPLSSCMFLGGSFYLASSLINQDMNVDWLKTIFSLFSKILISCTINILILYVCELFPCEIRCSSFSFFLSIKHLSEMFAIYLFKVNLLSMNIIKIGLSVFCILLCVCSFLLPERSAFSFNLDYLEYLNRNQASLAESSPVKKTCGFSSMCGSKNINTNDLESQKMDKSRYIIRINGIAQGPGPDLESEKKLNESANSGKMEDSKLIANSLIKKINSENHSKTGKLNPLYEEEQIIVSISSINVDSDNNTTCNLDKSSIVEESSTKF